MGDLVAVRRRAAFALCLAAAVALVLMLTATLAAALIFFALGAATLVARLWRIDRAFAAICAVAALTLGPLAGPAIILATAGPRGAGAKGLADSMPQVPDPTRAERICGEVAEGRRPLDAQAAPQSLIHIFDRGTLADQQAALAALIRHYTPELRPALDRALASDIPAVRVQAAAVFAHLRDTFAARARVLQAGESGLSGAALAAEAAEVAACGFVDPMIPVEPPRAEVRTEVRALTDPPASRAAIWPEVVRT